MDIADVIAERKIREAKERGEFDDLPGKGKPIADIDRIRGDGWWAERAVREERERAARDDG